ncbi:valine--tRNA ligase-like [Anopheles nili]|uniref:valine--tRNA ligase-like n=1 Tax=Anopheles nili TaxID=185578 RepID=UPI00237BF1EE|nr:valine--tRNA ligase-like [Anopheles nili]
MEPFAPFLTRELLTYLSPTAAAATELSRTTCWIDSELEDKIDRMLHICQHVRQLKNEFTPPIVRKHKPIVHIHAKSKELTALLEEQRDIVQHLTLCNGVLLHSDRSSFNSQPFVVKCAPSHDCLIGIVAESLESLLVNQQSAASDANKKILIKLDAEIEKLQKTINNDGYQKSASAEVQKRHNEKLNRLLQQKEEMFKITN